MLSGLSPPMSGVLTDVRHIPSDVRHVPINVSRVPLTSPRVPGVRRCLIKWLEVRKVCPLCNMPVLQLAQLHGKPDPGPPQVPLPGSQNIV